MEAVPVVEAVVEVTLGGVPVASLPCSYCVASVSP